MKKKAQLGFTLVLILISLLSIFTENEHITMIVCASVVPSFILSVTSFIEEIMDRCEQISIATSDRWNGGGERIKEIQKEMESFEPEKLDSNYMEQYHGLLHMLQNYQYQAQSYEKTQEYIVRLNRKLSYIYVISYAVFFLSIVFAPQMTQLFKYVNSNAISLWSLTILFINNELKPELSEYVFARINKTLNGGKNHGD